MAKRKSACASLSHHERDEQMQLALQGMHRLRSPGTSANCEGTKPAQASEPRERGSSLAYQRSSSPAVSRLSARSF